MKYPRCDEDSCVCETGSLCKDGYWFQIGLALLFLLFGAPSLTDYSVVEVVGHVREWLLAHSKPTHPECVADIGLAWMFAIICLLSYLTFSEKNCTTSSWYTSWSDSSR